MSRKKTVRKPITRKTGIRVRKPAAPKTKPAFEIRTALFRIICPGESSAFKRQVFDRLFWLVVLVIIAITVIAVVHPGPAIKGAGMTGAGVGVGAGIRKLYKKRHPT